MTADEENRFAWQAAGAALYALNDLLERKGLLERGEWAAELRRWSPEDADHAAIAAGLVAGLEAQYFARPERPNLRLVSAEADQQE